MNWGPSLVTIQFFFHLSNRLTAFSIQIATRDKSFGLSFARSLPMNNIDANANNDQKLIKVSLHYKPLVLKMKMNSLYPYGINS